MSSICFPNDYVQPTPPRPGDRYVCLAERVGLDEGPVYDVEDLQDDPVGISAVWRRADPDGAASSDPLPRRTA
jgi:hypothetical protein